MVSRPYLDQQLVLFARFYSMRPTRAPPLYPSDRIKARGSSDEMVRGRTASWWSSPCERSPQMGPACLK
jgi:hypothetical protein